MDIKFEPATKTDQDNFNILEDGVAIGTFFWKRNHPKPRDKVAVVRDLEDGVAIVPNEAAAIAWIKKFPSRERMATSLLVQLIMALHNEEQDAIHKVVETSVHFLQSLGDLNAADQKDSTEGEKKS